MSSAASTDHVQPVELLMDGRSTCWHPAKISDRKLLELQQRLVMVRRLGGSFAKVSLSPQAQSRLHLLLDHA